MDDRTVTDRPRAIDDHKRLQTVVDRLATLDASTHVYTREHFLSLAQREIDAAGRDGRAVSFLVLHLDHAKRANDGAVGDQVLSNVAAVLLESVRVLDVVARYGAEKFAVMLPETTRADACVVAERILERIGEIRIPTGKATLRITASIAVASLSPDDEAADNPLTSLLSRTDGALRAARRAARSQTIVL